MVSLIILQTALLVLLFSSENYHLLAWSFSDAPCFVFREKYLWLEKWSLKVLLFPKDDILQNVAMLLIHCNLIFFNLILGIQSTVSHILFFCLQIFPGHPRTCFTNRAKKWVCLLGWAVADSPSTVLICWLIDVLHILFMILAIFIGWCTPSHVHYILYLVCDACFSSFWYPSKFCCQTYL